MEHRIVKFFILLVIELIARLQKLIFRIEILYGNPIINTSSENEQSLHKADNQPNFHVALKRYKLFLSSKHKETQFAIMDNLKLQYLFLLWSRCIPHFCLSKSIGRMLDHTCVKKSLGNKWYEITRRVRYNPFPDWYVSRIGFIHLRPPLLNWNPVISLVGSQKEK